MLAVPFGVRLTYAGIRRIRCGVKVYELSQEIQYEQTITKL